MKFFNIYQAKTQLSALVDSACSGEEVVIARSGKPLVKLVPFIMGTKRRKPGFFKGKIKILDNFDKD